MATDLTRMADPPGETTARSMLDMDVSADGKVLATSSYSYVTTNLGGGDPYWGDSPDLYLWYLADDGTSYGVGFEINTPSYVNAVRFHPSGRYLITTDYDGRLLIYTRTASDTPAGVGWTTPGSDLITGGSGGRVSFDATGDWMTVCYSNGADGLYAFDQLTGTATRTAAAADYGWQWAAINPADPTLLGVITLDGYVYFYRRDAGGNLSQEGGRWTEATFPTRLVWHPSGSLLLLDRYNSDDTPYDGATLFDAWSYPQAQRVRTFTELAGATDVRFASNGLLAAGCTYTPDPNAGFACGQANPAGLVVMDIAPDGSGDIVLRPHDAGVQVSGSAVAWANSGGTLRLAAGTTPDPGVSQNTVYTAQYRPGVEVWPPQAPGFAVYASAAPAASSLYMKQPNGAYALVGVEGQPLSFRLPDGSMRTWPGSGYPLFMEQPDGSWKKVIG